jgi:putative nucleotidyltransferase with HDIG domain
MGDRSFRRISILFVDEEPLMHNALKRGFRKMGDLWDLHFAANPVSALKTLATMQFDVIVTATTFSGSNGLDLLESVRKQYPRIVRIILSGSVTNDDVLNSVDVTHQYLTKPFDEGDIIKAIDRAYFIKKLLSKDAFRQIISSVDSLPGQPAIYLKLVETLKSADATISDIAKLVCQDLSLSARFLKLANSAYFGRPQHISDPFKAVSLLGIDIVKAVTLSSGVMESFKKFKLDRIFFDDLWDHAMATGLIAKAISQVENLDKHLVDAAFSAGLFHDIGKLLIAAYLPESFNLIQDYIRSNDVPMVTAEQEILGTTHAAIGAYLLGLWGLPREIIEMVAYHHNPSGFQLDDHLGLAILHVAGTIEKNKSHDDNTETVRDSIDHRFLPDGDAAQRVESWEQAVMELPAL